MSAEGAYLFRHALMRVAAYELQPPQERSELHAHAYAIIEALPTDDADLYAHELADHARDATIGNPDKRRRREMLKREAGWLKRAMLRARARSNFRPALECAERLLDSTAADPADRHAGGVMAAEMAASIGEYSRVPRLLQRIEKLEPQCDSAEARINRLLTWVSAVLLPHRDYEKAREASMEARNVSRESGNRLGEARATGFLGNVDSLLGRREHAVEHYEASLKIFRELNHRRGISTSVGNLGLVYRYFGRMDDAEAAYREALKIDREDGNREGVARHIGNLGVLYRDTGRLDEAIELLTEAGDLFRDLGELAGCIRNGTNLGDAYINLGQKQRAALQFQQSEKIARECGLNHHVADCLFFRGNVLLEQNDAVRGEPAMGEAATLYEQLGELKAAAESWEKLCASAFEREDYGTAQRCAESCLSNLDACGEATPEAEYTAAAILAESALAVELHNKAAKYAARALKLAPAHENDPIRVATLKAIAKMGQASSAT